MADEQPRTIGSRRRYQYIDKFLNTPGPSTDPDFVPGAPTIANLENSKVLVM